MAHRPDLIVIGSPTARLRPTDAGGIAAEYADVSDLDSLFQPEEHRFEALHPEIDHETLSRHFRVVAPEDRLEELAERLAGHRDIRAAYVKPAGSPPIADAKLVLLDLDHPDVAEPPSDPTPDYLSRQGYLEDAPIGVGALSAWNLAGGRGQGVNIIDCEFGWNFAHEDLQQNTTGLIHGTNIDNDEWVQHGTAVLGIFGGDPNQIGVTGICPEATVSGAAFGKSSARTIRWAADQLQPGDILLIELERTLNNDSGQSPFSPVEWWPDDFEVIRRLRTEMPTWMTRFMTRRSRGSQTTGRIRCEPEVPTPERSSSGRVVLRLVRTGEPRSQAEITRESCTWTEPGAGSRTTGHAWTRRDGAGRSPRRGTAA
jgi:hypothetical protein